MTDNTARTIGALLRQSVTGDGAERRVHLDPAFQGFPDTAHGGSVLALFDAVASTSSARTLSGIYRRRVPLATPLALAVDRDGATTRLCLSDGAGALVEGAVTPIAGSGVARIEPSGTARPLPISRTCFACGVENPIGLKAAPRIDESGVHIRWEPRTAAQTISSVVITTLLDEAAFWLGAAATGESGMTTELVVTVHGAIPRDGALSIAGARASARPKAGDARYWDTDVGAWDGAGRLVATARITFVAIRGAARKLVTSLFAINAREVLQPIFPTYVR